ncbi:MAG: DEAD/DEAH box helicase [Bacteroidales bacterium]|nr:DEAD/DEAH box helicase [Bacteroidales bacterium]
MTTKNNSLQTILDKFSIQKLNAMQEEAQHAIRTHDEVVLLSPTGTGKTLAYLLPVVQELDVECSEIQALIIVPSRELAIQIEQVAREMGSGFKCNAVYGGRSGAQDKIDLKHRPAILIGTPGRIADHIRRERFSTDFIKILVLDEFDKSLEVGFESEMIEIVDDLPNVKKTILTSATQKVKIPPFIGLRNPTYIDYLHEGITQLKIQKVISPSKDKLKTLVLLLEQLKNESGIIFCNFKDALQRVSDFLTLNNIKHDCFHGGMEQIDRERSLIKFRNGSHQLLVATDLAARGLDIPEIRFIIHYHLPARSKEFIHRNGRTARMNSNGTAYILLWENEELPDFIHELNPENFELKKTKKSIEPTDYEWKTLYISGGRRDKISKGDIAGLILKQGNINKDELGNIEIKQDCAFAGVIASKAEAVIALINNSKLKKKKVRVSLI